MINKIIISTAVIVCIIIGSVCIPLILKNISDVEKDLAKASLQRIHDRSVSLINSEIIALNNYLTLVSEGLTEVYNLNGTLDNFQRIADAPFKLTSLGLIRITYFRIITTENQLNQHVDYGMKLYNVSNFLPYNLVNGSAVTIAPGTETYPMLLLLIASPKGTSPGLPKFGSFNAESVGGQETIFISQMNDTEFSVGRIIRRVRVDGSLNVIIPVSNKNKDWISVAQFDVSNFLDETLGSVDNAIIEISDSNIFYTSKSKTSLEKSNHAKTTLISFKLRSWTVTTTLSVAHQQSFQTESSMIIVIILVCLLILIIGATVAGLYTAKVVADRNLYQQIQVIHNSHNIAVHEIRGIMNTISVIYQLRSDQSEMTDEDSKTVRSGINNCIHILSNLLDYEKLLHGTYVPMIDVIDIEKTIKDIIDKYNFVNITLTYQRNMPLLKLDQSKLLELIHNGLNNATKHTSNHMVMVRIQRINSNLFIEIINDYNEIPSDFSSNDLFIPFFIRESSDKKIWHNTIKTLQCDQNWYEQISPYMGHSELDTVVKKQTTNIDGKKWNVKSTGLGLSISRLLAKALRGECGLDIDTQSKRATYWIVLPCEAVSAPSNTDLDLDLEVLS